jgi:HPt (histidine-containing phosphotransfer) domain-containing protein
MDKDKDAEEKKALAEMAQFSQDLGLYEDFDTDQFETELAIKYSSNAVEDDKLRKLDMQMEDLEKDDNSLPQIETTIQLSPEAQLRLVELLSNPELYPVSAEMLRAKENSEKLFGKQGES